MSNETNNYLRSSSLTKTFHYNEEIDPETQKPRKERAEFHNDVTEELSITLTYEKAQDLLNRIGAAMKDESGTGGVRISMYCRKSQNQRTGEVFDGMGILVYAQKPNPHADKFRKGSFRGNAGGGRRDFPKPQATATPATRSTPTTARPTNDPRNNAGPLKSTANKAAINPAVYNNEPEF